MAQNAEDRSCITQFELGEMFEKNDGARDYTSAFRWYLRSAKHGYRKAQHRLGTMYARGVGVTRNYIEAYAWCKVSAAQHSQRAILKLKKIEAYMSAEQITKARKLSRQYYEMYVAPFANRALIREQNPLMGIFPEFFAEFEDVFIEGDGRYDLEVVGESHYQRHLNVLSGRYSKKGGDSELIAKLHYENTNPHDKKAIRVVINGGTVGYLSLKDARLFRKRIEKVGLEGLVISCNVEIVGGKRAGLFKKTDFGVWLDLPIKNLQWKNRYIGPGLKKPARERGIVVNLTHMGDVDVSIACVVLGVIRNKDEALWISPLKLHQHQQLAF